MGNFQTAKTGYITPSGVELAVLASGESVYFDLGVMADGLSFTHNYAAPDVENGNQTDAPKDAKDQSMTISPSALRTWETEALEKISGGLITRTVIAGTPVAGATQTLTSGTWAKNVVELIEGQNGDGTTPTINSVTGGTDGAYVLGTDYEIIQAQGGWSISLFGAGVTTEAQDVVIDYDYTPAAGSTLTSGSASQVLDPFVLRVRHYTNDAFTLYDYEAKFFKTNLEPGSLVQTKSGSLAANTLDEWNAVFTATPDADLTSGEQLFSIYFGEKFDAFNEDEKSLARKIAKVLTTEFDRELLRKEVTEKLSWEAKFCEFDSLYRDVIATVPQNGTVMDAKGL